MDEPECYDGECTACPKLGMCVHCGATMFEEGGSWFHHSQDDIPFVHRKPQFVMEKEKLPPGVREWGSKFKACIPSKINRYVGTFTTIDDAVKAQADYRELHGIPEPKIGRPKKEKP